MQYSSAKAALRYAAFLKDVPALNFDSKNPHFKNEYLSLPGLLDAIKPALEKHNAVLTTGTTIWSEVEGFNVLDVEFLFVDGDEAHTARSLTLVPSLDNPQHFGSYLTYARRYAILSALGAAADKDDDAQATATVSTSFQPSRRGLQRHGRQ